METVDRKDVQGFILKGYGKLKATRYYLLHFSKSETGKNWLKTTTNEISDGNHQPTETALNIAFTAAGLSALGLDSENLKDFSREFKEGMDTDHRSRLLGDLGANDPKKWLFGSSPENAVEKEKSVENIHSMLMAFAKDETTLELYHQELKKEFDSYGISIIESFDGRILDDNKIHIGFKDGISQPIIKGTGMNGPENNMVATGEFLMGYKNEYHVYPDTPSVYKNQGDLSLLPTTPADPSRKDLGFNGSYLVYRKMEEKVDLFWKYMNENTKNDAGQLDEKASIKLAAKMVGRWPNGAPIVKFPEEEPAGLSDDNDFGYHATDKDAQKCPFGSHMRRNNPRDSFEDNTAKESLSLTNKHRIIRRGRSYGEPLISTPTNHKPKDEIGLHFMCFNADIAGQFEFVQHTWANYPKFENLYNDPDPITGVLDIPGETITQNFTVQDTPVNKCYQNLQQFVTVKGGLYLFFPSISVIKYLSTLE
jgi:Dyp-type peroxidase family